VDSRLLYYLGHIRSQKATLIKYKTLISPQCSNASSCLLLILQLLISDAIVNDLAVDACLPSDSSNNSVGANGGNFRSGVAWLHVSRICMLRFRLGDSLTYVRHYGTLGRLEPLVEFEFTGGCIGFGNIRCYGSWMELVMNSTLFSAAWRGFTWQV
jgi:hypothetical protein